MKILFAIISIAVLAAVVFCVMKMRRKPSQAQGKETGTIAAATKNALKDLKEILGSGELSYEEAMKYFIERKDDSPDIEKGALLKQAAGDCFKIARVFLDKNNNIIGTDKYGKPLGEIIKVKSLDGELFNLFKDNDLIVVE